MKQNKTHVWISHLPLKSPSAPPPFKKASVPQLLLLLTPPQLPLEDAFLTGP